MPIRVREADRGITRREVLRRWVSRETPKEGYPEADQSGWDAERLADRLESVYDEPAEPALRGAPDWTALRVEGAELGKFAAFPACGWDALSGHGTIGDAVDRLRNEDLREEFPGATGKIDAFRSAYPDREFGALLARQYDDDWPPILLEGNHRTCAANWASREGVAVELEVHLGYERPVEDLPLVGLG